jgi:hypothetical protein
MCKGCYGSDQGWDEHKTRSLGTLFMDKGFLERLSARRVGELLNLSKSQIRILTGLLTKHSHLEGNLFKMG